MGASEWRGPPYSIVQTHMSPARSPSQRERRPCVDVQELQNLRTDTNPAFAENLVADPIEPEVERDDRVGQRSHSEVVDTGSRVVLGDIKTQTT